MLRTLHRTQFIPAGIDRVWEFFATPVNLNALTPPGLNFETLGSPGPMYQGQLIAYRIGILPGVRLNWLTEIRHVRPGRYFVDEQRRGPYTLWYHEHHFEPRDGGVLMTDHVTYALPFGPLGDLVHALWVRGQLRHIFDYRYAAVERAFGSG